MIPVLGPLAAETLAHALESRQTQRQHEFIAAVTRAQRASAETASQQKRQRLAAAVANGGSWAPFAATEREQFTRLVDEFDALHIWLLHYFTNPRAWLQARDLYRQGIFESRTSAKGQHFLAFINESDSIAADAPTEL
ncbi:hypothetical protein [Microbacterium sp. SD291]|uniref:hypothetical protein n=1 Tax=Microbacterium sp. SD291 TaxID=2782007 RepID=UPI001A97CCC4|nr:hypothetical protein [Microbacterium sp. SD291]MBO0979280.1 hypothetical protein [Microbacterium sp. SD291]